MELKEFIRSRLLEYTSCISEAVSRRRNSFYISTESDFVEVKEFLRILGFTEKERIHIKPKEKEYCCRENFAHKDIIEFHFPGTDRRLYWGVFNKGVNEQMCCRIDDVTNPTHMDIVYDTIMSKGNIEEAAEFIRVNC